MTTLPHVSGSPIDERLLTIPLIGRDDDIRTLRGYLKTAITQIIGLGGLGKSRLAAELVQIEAPPDGAIWHVASDVSRADEVIVTLRKHYKLPLETERADLMAHIREKGADRLLVVIDNGESIDPQNRADERKAYVTLMKELRQHGAMVLLTSRLRWLELEMSKSHTPDRLTEQTAARVVEAMRDPLGVPADMPIDAAALAQAARFHPRLIEWALKQHWYLDGAAMIATLQTLEGADAQAALFEMIGKTVDQMCRAEPNDDQRMRLRYLCVFRGGFTYASAKAVTGAEDGHLQSMLRILSQWNFVVKRGDRYTIDPLVVEAVGIDPYAHAPHYEHYKALAWEHDKKQLYLELDIERANLEVAFAWAQDHDAEKAYWLLTVCQFYLHNRGRYEQRLAWAARAADALKDHADPDRRANVQNSLGIALQYYPFGDRRENLRRAAAALQAALAHWTEARSPQNYAMVQNNLAVVYRNLSSLDGEDARANLRAAEAAIHEALKIYTPDVVPLDYAMTQNNLGSVYGALALLDGEDTRAWLRKAEASRLEALKHRAVDRVPQDYAATQYNLGITYRDLSWLDGEDQAMRLAQAEAAYLAALTQYTEARAPQYFAQTMNHLGIVYEDMGDLVRALACWRSAEPVFRRLGLVERAYQVKEWIEDAERQLGGS